MRNFVWMEYFVEDGGVKRVWVPVERINMIIDEPYVKDGWACPAGLKVIMDTGETYCLNETSSRVMRSWLTEANEERKTALKAAKNVAKAEAAARSFPMTAGLKHFLK